MRPLGNGSSRGGGGWTLFGSDLVQRVLGGDKELERGNVLLFPPFQQINGCILAFWFT